MLGDHVASSVEQGVGCIVSRRIFGRADIDPGVLVDALYAEGKGVDAADNLRAPAALSGDIANFVAFGFHPCRNAGKIAGLIDAAGIAVEIFAVVFKAGALGKNNVRVLGGEPFHRFRVAGAGAEDDVAAFVNARPDGIFNRCLILVLNTVFANNLIILQAELGLHRHDALIVRMCVARCFVRVADMDHADLDLILRNRGERIA